MQIEVVEFGGRRIELGLGVLIDVTQAEHDAAGGAGARHDPGPGHPLLLERGQQCLRRRFLI
ncbi:hypothetical protein LP420_14015 [Massilia sp. B-10]|nr:hypothetical protein LP420_14015 [Massilia sp. B-10]